MPHIELKQTWVLKLSTQEYRLIVKALAGRSWSDEVEKSEARDLSRRLNRMRASTTKNTLQQTDKLLDQLEAEEL